jgi:hypothetical protein
MSKKNIEMVGDGKTERERDRCILTVFIIDRQRLYVQLRKNERDRERKIWRWREIRVDFLKNFQCLFRCLFY